MKIVKSITLVFAVGFLVANVSLNKDLLSKFHQHGYKIKDVRIQLMSYDKIIYNFFEVKPFKYNRTTTAHNGSFNLKFGTKDHTEMLVQDYKFLSNEYRDFPVRFQVNLKKFVDSNALGLKAMLKCGNMTSFYFYKDITYYFCNFVVDEAHLPPLIPSGRYKMEVTLLYLNKEVALLALFGEVYTPIAYPKK